MKKKSIIILTLIMFITVNIFLTSCGLFGKKETPDWQTKPTALTTPELAIFYLAKVFELPEELFYSTDEELVTAVTAERSLITGLVIYLNESLWEENIYFFLVTRDSLIYYNLGGEEDREDLFLVSRYLGGEDGSFTPLEESEAEVSETSDEETPPESDNSDDSEAESELQEEIDSADVPEPEDS